MKEILIILAIRRIASLCVPSQDEARLLCVWSWKMEITITLVPYRGFFVKEHLDKPEERGSSLLNSRVVESSQRSVLWSSP